MDKNGWTALHFAAFHGRLGCVQLLLRWGGHAYDVENSGCNAGQKIYELLVFGSLHMRVLLCCAKSRTGNHRGIYSARCYASAEYWKRFTAHFDGVHAFRYKSAASELIWMKSGAL